VTPSSEGLSDTIQSLWIGERLSRIEILSIRSFLANGHDYHLYVYSNVEGIPDGVTVRDANTILPEALIFRSQGSLSIFADWFRQELLYACGGYWADLDMVCLKPLRFDDPVVIGKQDCTRVCNALMRFPRSHPVTRMLADLCRDPNMILSFDNSREKRKKLFRRYLLGNRRANVGWGESSGPSGLTRMLKNHHLLKTAKPFYYFYPLPYSLWTCAFDDSFREGPDFFSSSYCVHLWNEKLRRIGGIDKNGPFPAKSLVQQLMQRYDC